MSTIHRRVCPLCEACCGLLIQTDGERITAIRGDAEDVLSAGYICPKAVALKDLHEDPDRLRTPLIRRNGVHQPATWDEAYAEIERRLLPIVAAHGRDALALTAGNPSVHKIGLITYFGKLARAAGTRNVFTASTLDQMPKQLSSALMFGHWLSIPVPDLPRTDYLLILGANPVVSNGSMWTVPDFRGKAKALLARGGRLVVIDPRRTETAALASAYHPIRPGTDVYLLAAMVHVLFDEGLLRLGRLQPWVQGLDELRQALLPFPPERMAERCGWTAEQVRGLARDLAQARRAAVYGRLGTCGQRHGTLCSWLIDVLNVLTGNLDQAGGAMFPKAAAFAANTQGQPGQGQGVRTGRHKARVSGAPEVYGELPMTCLAEEIDTPGDGQVRALITVASNPVLSSPGSERLEAALAQLDFMVSVDVYLNETTRFADVILPGRSPLEDAHYDVAFPQLAWHNVARYSPSVFTPPSEAMAEWQILLKLAAIVQGQGAQANLDMLDDVAFAQEMRRLVGDDVEAIVRATDGLRGPDRALDVALRLGPYGDQFGRRPGGLTLVQVRHASEQGGVDLGPLAPRIPEMLRTTSGRIELAPLQLLQKLEQLTQEAYRPAADWVIIGRRDVRSNNSWMHNLPVLAKGPFRGALTLHPQDAERLGVVAGDQLRVHGATAHVEVEVALDEGLSRGVVCLPHGWGHDRPGTQLQVGALRPGANLNALLDASLRDSLSGNAVLSGVPVKLERI